MTRYSVTAQAEGVATVYVYAPDDLTAERIAYENHLTGFTISGGSIEWVVTDIEEARDDN